MAGHEISFWLGDCAAPGSATREVVMTGDQTCRARFSGQAAYPVAEFLASSAAGIRRVGDLVFFNGHQSHVFDPVTGAEDPSGIRSFAWDFDNDGVAEAFGGRSTAGIAQHAFQSAGDHLVRLEVEGGPFDTADLEARTLSVVPAAGPLSSLTVSKGGTGQGTIRTDPPGLVTCRDDCVSAGPVLIDPTVTITLSAVAGPGSSFAGWSGAGCTGTSPSVPVAMDASRTCTATFVRHTFNLSVLVNGPAGSIGRITSVPPGGIDCGTGGSVCSEAIAPGTTVVLRPDDSSIELNRFAGWVGCDSVGALFACSVTMNANRTVSATFRP
jgi:hypothetical protein